MIVIDPAHGGSDFGNNANGIIEKDLNLKISEYIYNRLKQLGANVKIIRNSDIYISDSDRAKLIKDAYGNNSNVVAISNRLSNNSDAGAEIIYALRNKDALASSIAGNLADSGQNVNKWYQRRSESNTSKDYYSIQRDTDPIETIIVEYGSVNNVTDANKLKNNYEKYAEAVVKSVANYKGIPYYNESGISDVYVVKKGDSLYSIANKYGTTVNELKSYNNLTSNLLNIGDVLKIPVKVKDEGNTVKEKTYTVKKGDSLYSIANKYSITIDNLKKLNNLTSNLINIGDILVVGEIPIDKELNEEIYIVQKGDSLYSISKKFNTTVDELKKLNKLTGNLLSIDQKLIVSVGDNDSIIYVVQKGDSLYSIANKYGTSVDKIKKDNNLSSNLLSIGQKLII